MIDMPKNYQKPIDEEKQRCQDMITQSKIIRDFVHKWNELKSVPRHVVDENNINSVAADAIQSSSKEVLKDDKKRPLKLEEMTRKQRRAAEYRIMREAENKSSQFLTSLNSASRMGSASTSSRKEAARKAIMGMELPEKIRERMKGEPEQEAPKKLKKLKAPKAPKAPRKPKVVKETKKESEKLPEHPSWAAQRESKEKMRLHIDPNAPRENKRITFD